MSAAARPLSSGFLLAFVVGVFLAIPIRDAAAGGLVETLSRVKPSIVAVGTFQRTRSPAFRFLGTGFAVGDGSLIATNAHVVPEGLAEEQMEMLVIAVPGGDRSTVRRVVKAAIDKDHDLALLRLDGVPLPALRLSGADPVREGQSVALTGFPIGSVLGLAPVTHRGIIAAITPIGIPQASAGVLNPSLIRRLSTNPFRVYQLDATTYPGNSGSPVFIPESGDVIGVVNMVFVKSTKESILSEPSGISYAIPARYLKTLLDGMK